MVKSVTAVSKPFPDGQRVTSIEVAYDSLLQPAELDVTAFEVADRTVTRVYIDGSRVVIELDPKDGMASTLTRMDGRPISMPRLPRPGGHGGPGGPGGGPPKRVLPDGRIFVGPSGLGSKRMPVRIPVKQNVDIAAANGSVYAAWDNPVLTNREDNELADLFIQRMFEDVCYNLYIPENYDPNVKYPLVMFIHDAGYCSEYPRSTLEQGMGATVFASPEEQAKHPCFVVAPQHSKELPIANDMYWCLDDEHTFKRLLDALQQEYSIDENRIYTTGQSMGFMTSCQLLIDYPDYFAGALLPAGHWDIEKTAGIWNQNVWMFLSEEDRGGMSLISNLPQAIEKIGGKISIYEWDADQPTAVISDLVREVSADPTTFKMTIFPGDSIMRPNQPDRTDGGGHNGTWHFVYQIEAARDWLFDQKKG